MIIKVMSWNTFLGHNVGGVVEHIFQENPDIIGLQEIVEGYPTAQTPNTAHLIRDKLAERNKQYYVAYFPAFKSDRHPTKHTIGNAILSRFPLLEKKRHFLSDLKMYKERKVGTVPRDAEPRIAIEAQIEVGDRNIRIINTHLGVSENLKPTKYTDVQMERLINLIGRGEDTVLMGDFNATPESEYIRCISRVLKNVDTEQLPTWPALQRGIQAHQERYGGDEREAPLLTHRIDQIFIGKGLRVEEFYLGGSLASDHRSLLAMLKI